LINQQVALKWVKNKIITKPVQSRVLDNQRNLLSGYELNNGITAIQSLTTQIIIRRKDEKLTIKAERNL
jgi:hypothetical protein